MTVDPSKPLLPPLLARGDVVEVVRGLLTITPASGLPVPPEWLREHQHQITTEAARAAGVDALEYLGYSVGNYGPSKRGGVSLQFRNLVDGSERYSVFNAETRRDRNTQHGKKGSPLPRGQFRVTERFKFYGFWLSTGLPVPRRLSAFHDYMGKLASLVFTGTTTDGERVGDPCPLSLSHTDLVRLLGVNTAPDAGAAPGAGAATVPGDDTLSVEIGAGQLPDSCRTTAGQLPDNSRTTAGQLPDKSAGQGNRAKPATTGDRAGWKYGARKAR